VAAQYLTMKIPAADFRDPKMRIVNLIKQFDSMQRRCERCDALGRRQLGRSEKPKK